MIFEFKNLGAVKEAEIEMGRLTVVSGKNNTGKTYLTYAIWGLLSRRLSYITSDYNTFTGIDKEALASELNAGVTKKIDINQLLENFKTRFSHHISEYSKQLYTVFDVAENIFSNTTATAKISDEDIKNGLEGIQGRVGEEIIFYYKNIKGTSLIEARIEKKRDIPFDADLLENCLGFIDFHIFRPAFILTAQRDAIHLFKNTINRQARFKVREGFYERDKYAMPLESQIDFASDLNKLEQYNSFLHELGLIDEIEEILGVKYRVHFDSFQIESANGSVTPAFMASTSVRTLADLHFYLKHRAIKNSLLMIDEPELNLHPENQIKIARLLVKLVNAGLRVWITTHSDYIVKELNNCLMLSNNFEEKERFMEEYGYKENDILKKEDFRIYIAQEDGTVDKVKIGKLGMEKTTFDDAIKRFNEVSDTLFNILD